MDDWGDLGEEVKKFENITNNVLNVPKQIVQEEEDEWNTYQTPAPVTSKKFESIAKNNLKPRKQEDFLDEEDDWGDI